MHMHLGKFGRLVLVLASDFYKLVRYCLNIV